MTFIEIGNLSIAPQLNAPLATTKAGGVAIGAGLVVGSIVVIAGIALINK